MASADAAKDTAILVESKRQDSQVQVSENGATTEASTTTSQERKELNDVSLEDLDSEQMKKKEEKKCKVIIKARHVVSGILFVVAAIVWGLLTLPIIFYYLPADAYLTQTNSTTTNNTRGPQCLSVIPYDGPTCQNELLSLRNCIPNNDRSEVVLVQSDETQTIRPLLDALTILGSVECRAAAVPFLCVHFFGLCDSTGKAYRPSSSQCIEISTGVCATEWKAASNFPGVTLPDCTSFPDETILMESCDSNNSTMDVSGSGMLANESSSPAMPPAAEQSLGNQCNNITCRKGFYCREGDNETDVCLPICNDWSQYSDGVTLAIDILVLVTVSIGFLSGIAFLIIAVIRRKKMFLFPTSMTIYQTIALLSIGVIALIGYFDRAGLYCSSQDFLQSIANPTVFCTITGLVVYYGLAQVGLWWIFHMTALFWRLKFPFHAQSFDRANRTKYLHGLCVTLALLLPLIPIIIQIGIGVADESPELGSQFIGFRFTRSPPLLCTGSDTAVAFYSLILPLDIILFTGFPILVMIFWIMHKNHMYMKSRSKKQNQRKKNAMIGTAEKKILIIFSYYILFSVVGLMSFSAPFRNQSVFIEGLTLYFLCEQSGHDINNPCDRGLFETVQNPGLETCGYLLLALYPVANLIYVANVEDIKKSFKKLKRRVSRKYTQRSILSTNISFLSLSRSPKNSIVNHNSQSSMT